MSIAQTFLDYASAFELSYEDDDWSRLETYFTPEAVYVPLEGQEIRGRAGILAYLRRSVEDLDRRFDSRVIDQFPVPQISGDQAIVPWKVTYKKAGVPDLVLSGVEKATFSGDAICKLEDLVDEGIIDRFENWMKTYGRSLA